MRIVPIFDSQHVVPLGGGIQVIVVQGYVVGEYGTLLVGVGTENSVPRENPLLHGNGRAEHQRVAVHVICNHVKQEFVSHQPQTKETKQFV